MSQILMTVYKSNPNSSEVDARINQFPQPFNRVYPVVLFRPGILAPKVGRQTDFMGIPTRSEDQAFRAEFSPQGISVLTAKPRTGVLLSVVSAQLEVRPAHGIVSYWSVLEDAHNLDRSEYLIQVTKRGEDLFWEQTSSLAQDFRIGLAFRGISPQTHPSLSLNEEAGRGYWLGQVEWHSHTQHDYHKDLVFVPADVRHKVRINLTGGIPSIDILSLPELETES